MQRSDDFVGVNRRQNRSGVLQGGKFFRGLSLTEVVGLTVITNHILWIACNQSTKSVGLSEIIAYSLQGVNTLGE